MVSFPIIDQYNIKANKLHKIRNQFADLQVVPNEKHAPRESKRDISVEQNDHDSLCD